MATPTPTIIVVEDDPHNPAGKPDCAAKPPEGCRAGIARHDMRRFLRTGLGSQGFRVLKAETGAQS